MTYPVDNGETAPDGGCGSIVGYGCLPNGGLMEVLSTDTCTLYPCEFPEMTVDCGKLILCHGSSVCACTATSCTVTVPTAGNVAFDMQLMSGALNGSVTGLGTQVYDVHLMRGS
jgi:hypothetical protein